MCVFVLVLCVDSRAQAAPRRGNVEKSILIGQLLATEPLTGLEVKYEASRSPAFGSFVRLN